MSYTRTSSSTMLNSNGASSSSLSVLPPPPHLSYVGAMQSNGGSGSGQSSSSAAPPLLQPTKHQHQQHESRCDCHECTYCQKPMGNLSIKCCECVDFHLCLKCYSMSAEIGEHKKDHNYFVVSKLSFPLFDSDKLWTYKEELLLLQFIEQYGFGNWDEIAKHLPSRTAQECLQHYNSYYIYGNLGKYTFNANSRNILMSNGSHAGGAKANQHFNETPWYTPTKQSQATGKSTGNNSTTTQLLPSMGIGLTSATSPSETVLLPPVEMSSEEQRALGYMPLRDDFERDHKNDAESLLSNLAIAHNQVFLLGHQPDLGLTNGGAAHSTSSMLTNGSNGSAAFESKLAAFNAANLLNFSASSTTVNSSPSVSSMSNVDVDDVIDYELKLTLIKMYCDCLNERQRYKQVAREYGLVNNASSLINSHAIALVNGAYGLTDPKYITSLNNGTLSQGGPGRKRKNPMKLAKELDVDNEKLKKFAQLMSASEYESLLLNIKKHRNLTKRLNELTHSHAAAAGTSKSGGGKIKETLSKLKREEESPLSTPQFVKPERRKKFSFKPASTSPSKQTPSKRMKRDQSPTTYKLNDSYFQKMKQELKGNDSGLNSESIASSVRKSTSSRASSRSSSVSSQISVDCESSSIADSTSKSSSAATATTTSEGTSKSTTSSNSRLYKIANKQKYVDYDQEVEEGEEEAVNGGATSEEEEEEDEDANSDELEQEETDGDDESARNGDDDGDMSTTTTNMTGAATDEEETSSLNSSANGIARRLRGHSTSTSKISSSDNQKSPKKENGRRARRVSTRSACKGMSSESSKLNRSSRSRSQTSRKLKRLVYEEDEEAANGDEASSLANADETDDTAQNSSDPDDDEGEEDEETTEEDGETRSDLNDESSTATTNDHESLSNGCRKLTRSNSKHLNSNSSSSQSRSSPSKEAKGRRAGRLCSMPGYNLLSENEKKQLKQFA